MQTAPGIGTARIAVTGIGFRREVAAGAGLCP